MRRHACASRTRAMDRFGCVFVFASAALAGSLQSVHAASAVPTPAPPTLFALHCAGCHGFDGNGHPQQGVPSMHNTPGQFMRLSEGRAFLVQVPGINNAGLSDAQIAALSNWLLHTWSSTTLPENWQGFDATELPALRAQRPVDIMQTRRDIVARLRALGHAIDEP